MRKFNPLLSAGFAISGLFIAPVAASAQPYVIQGVGPRDARGAQPIVQAATPAPSNYGGGFIEMLMSGGLAPAPAPMAYAQPMRTQPAAYANPNEPAYVTEPAHAMDPMFLRQDVVYTGNERPGTIVVDTPNKLLYLVEPGGRALRYGIGVGRPGFAWAGMKTISRKAEWPDWTPPPEMIKRRPDLPSHMEGGPANPLGARALYLGSSLYRIHGTNEPETIGRNVSSGCIRMMNEDVVDLYGRVGVGTRVIVM